MVRDNSPIEIVSREIGLHGSMEANVILNILKRILWKHMSRAFSALHVDPTSTESLELCEEYRTISELIVSYGSTLTALEDMEEDELSGS